MSSLAAVCTDFYVNQKISLKLDLPSAREPVLNLFDRVRRDWPEMDRFRRHEGELALEAREEQGHYNWIALDRTNIRSGWVNPESLAQAYRLHRLILEVAPYYLSISPLDAEYIEILFGFDIEASGNRNERIFDALFSQSPLAGLFDREREFLLESQPFVGFSLSRKCDVQAYVEVRSRTRASDIAEGRDTGEPISVYLTVRRYGPFGSIESFLETFGTLAGYAERLAEDRVIPCVVVPLRGE